MPIRAVRGATQVSDDARDTLMAAVSELLEAILERNTFGADDLISIIFTATDDLRADFPAYAVRSAGITDVPLLCARELAVDGAMPRVVRVLAHVETTQTRQEIRHVYLNGAAALRTDLPQ
ncbi:MAG: chorismate mutase [Actinomycetes bacterium]